MKFIGSFKSCALLTFPLDMPPFEFQELNVSVRPYGCGTSNILKAIELIRIPPTDLAAANPDGGGAAEWFWEADTTNRAAIDEIETRALPHEVR